MISSSMAASAHQVGKGAQQRMCPIRPFPRTCGRRGRATWTLGAVGRRSERGRKGRCRHYISCVFGTLKTPVFFFTCTGAQLTFFLLRGNRQSKHWNCSVVQVHSNVLSLRVKTISNGLSLISDIICPSVLIDKKKCLTATVEDNICLTAHIHLRQ